MKYFVLNKNNRKREIKGVLYSIGFMRGLLKI